MGNLEPPIILTPNLHLFGLREEAEVPREKPRRHGENIKLEFSKSGHGSPFKKKSNMIPLYDFTLSICSYPHKLHIVLHNSNTITSDTYF